MKKIIGIIAAFCLMLTVVLTGVSCSSISGNAANNSPTPSATQVMYSGMVENFVKNSSTYKFDGIDGSLKISKVIGSMNGDGEFAVEYQTRQAGHGNRTGQILAQVITNHIAIIQVKAGQITSAICDGNWDILSDRAAAAETSKVSLGTEFTLPVGQSVTISGEDLTIKFEAVTADSRSPKGAETIWAGEAKIQMQITFQGSASSVVLTEKGSTEGYTQDTVNQYKINFQLQPYPEVGYQPAQGDYKLVMKITK